MRALMVTDIIIVTENNQLIQLIIILPLGLNINIAKCELFSSRDLSSFSEETRRSNVPHFEILGAPIGELVFCAKFVAQKQSDASKLLKELEAVGSIDPQVAVLLLRQCGSFCRLVHLARNTPPLLVNEPLPCLMIVCSNPFRNVPQWMLLLPPGNRHNLA